MTNFLFSTPWYVLLTLAMVGGIVARSGNQRRQAGPRNVGLALVAAAVLLFTASFFVETDLEKVKRLNKELVQAVPAHDWAKMTDLLDPDATLGTTDATLYPNRTALVQGAKGAADRYGIKSVTIVGTEESQDPSGITVDINVLSKQDATDSFGIAGTASGWRMVWQPDGKTWRCHQIVCVKIGNEGTGSIGRLIGH